MTPRDSEKIVEAYLVRRMREIGGRAYKWVSPGTGGVPDRIVIAPGGRVHLVELKGAGGRLSEQQKHRFEELARMGCLVSVLWTREDVDRFVRGVLADAPA